MKINDNDKYTINQLLSIIYILIGVFTLLIVFIIIEPFLINVSTQKEDLAISKVKKETIKYWTAVDINAESDTILKKSLTYGQELIAHTSKYLGPKGSVLKMSNGLNCQNCHLQAGTAIFGNNYGAVASTYPKMRARSGSVENIYKRVNDCFQRSLNGKTLDTSSTEMQAITNYINYIGKDVKKGNKAAGSGFKDLAFLDRAADPVKGKESYTTKCQSCHQQNGEGVLNESKTEYTFPALWGQHSYNDGAGLYRVSNFAKYIKYNMPLGVTHTSPQLSDEESWDIAAYVNSQSRPHISVPKDWPDFSKKPIDHPFGPYADNFTEEQHKFGPYKPIANEKKKKEAASKKDKTIITTK